MTRHDLKENESMDNVTTPRLIVRRYAETDLADYMAYHQMLNNVAVLPIEMKNEKRAAQYLARQAVVADSEQEFWHGFAVYHREDAKVIGEVGIYLGGPPENKGDIGFELHPDYQGLGYGMEAAQTLLPYAFVTCDLRRITATCDFDNAKSYRLMERLGMTREGHFRQTRLTNGVWRDEYLYALLRDEWRARQEQE